MRLVVLLSVVCAACSSGSGPSTNPISDLERLEAAAAAGEHVREPDAADESDPDPVDLTPLPGAKRVELDRPGRSDVEFDGFVAGLPLWLDVPSTVGACNGPESVVMVVDAVTKEERAVSRAKESDIVVCENPPIDPFSAHNRTSLVLIPTCIDPSGALVGCEAYVYFERDNVVAAKRILAQFEKKYGEGRPVDRAYGCNASYGRDEFMYSWMIRDGLVEDQDFFFRIVVGFACEPDTGPADPRIVVLYQSPPEIVRRLKVSPRRST
ncbi:MAG: hypothetical protein ACRBN8_45780, partial [Nannocystales bacterium]